MPTPGREKNKTSRQKHEVLILANSRYTSGKGRYTARKIISSFFPMNILSSYITIGESSTVTQYLPSQPLFIMIILDQDLFSIEVILSISKISRPLTTSNEDALRIGLSRTPENLLERLLRMTCAPKTGVFERRVLFR